MANQWQHRRFGRSISRQKESGFSWWQIKSPPPLGCGVNRFFSSHVSVIAAASDVVTLYKQGFICFY